ncbi:MAG: branched-chain amino acid ABC transporter permease, partial [Acidimicrobiia bacterium]
MSTATDRLTAGPQQTTGSATRRPRRRAGWRPPSTLLLIAALTSIVGYYVFNGTRFSVYLMNTTLLACIGALALGLLMGTCGQVSIGNSAFLAAGGFTVAWASRNTIAFPYSVLLAMGVCAVVGLLVGLPALRIRGIYLALATLAAFFVVMFVVTEYQRHTVGAGAFIFEAPFGGDAVERGKTWAWVLLAVVSVTLVIVTWLRTGRSGRAWRMIRDHEVAAPMMGIPVARYKLMVFVISSALIGMQGALTAYFVGSLSYDAFTLGIAISYIAMILIGGADSQAGPLIGALIVTTMPTFVPDLVGSVAGGSVSAVHTAAYSQMAYGVLIILFIVYSP